MTNQGSYDLRHDVDRLQRKVNVFEEDFTDSYFIECSTPSVFYKSDKFSPSSITFYSYKDSKGKITTYKGILKIYSSVDGTAYKLIKTSTDSNTTINISDKTIKFYKCELYDEENKLLDSQSVPVLKDGEDGTNGSSPITIFLGNESQLIPCASNGKVQDTISFTIPFYCYKGTALYPCNYTPPSSNPFTQLGFSYKLDKQCSATDNGQITITATKDSTLRGLKGSIISLDFVVDNVTVTKQFNWAKVIKGEDGTDGADGKTPQLYIKYSKTANPTSMSELVDVETEGYDYQGLAWTYNNTAPTSVDDYQPFTIYDPQDGTPAPEGFVHFAYADDDKGATRFTTGKCDGRKYIGTCYDNQQSDPQEAGRYKWALIKGEDGKKPTTAEITEVIEQTNVDASTLEGKNPSSFLPSEIPVKYIYRDDNDKSKNMLRIYPLGNLMIIDVYNFSKGTANYGQDSQNTAYFNLLPDNKKLDPKYCPATSVFINDLNNADGSSNGRLRLTREGRVTKLGTESNGYNNTYGTFIYPIIPRIPTTLIVPTGKAYDYGDYFSMTLKDKDNNPVSNVNLTFELFGIYYQRKTDTNGVAKLQLRINPQTGLSLGGVFNGDTLYAPSDNIRYGSNSVVKTTGNITINRSGRQITIIVKNSHGNTLPNIELVFDGRILYTNENGEAYTTVDTNKTYTCSFGSSTSHVFSNSSFTKSIIVNDLADPVITLTKVPFYMTAGGSSGANKAYEKDSLSIGRVQNKEDTPDAGNAVRCIHNGSGYGSHVTPAQIYFNGFGLPKPSTKCVLTAKVWCGEFGGITGGSMPYPKLQIKDVVNNIVYKEEVISGVFNSSNKNVYLPLTVSWDGFTGDNRDIVASDNLAILVIPQRSSLNTTSSYNKSEFRIDYVEVTAQIQ